MAWLTLLYVSILFFLLIYWLKKRENQFWSNVGIGGFQSFYSFAFMKNFLQGTLKIVSFADQIKNAYENTKEYKCFGMYNLTEPIIMLRDQEMLRQITIKDFDYFQDHLDQFFKLDPESVFTKSLFALRGKQWRRMRATLSPAFTGRKMRGIFFSMLECGEHLAQHYKEELSQKPNGETLELEMKNVFTRLTTDVIATAAFGIEVNSFKNPENTFFKMGQLATQLNMIKMLFIMLLPSLARLFNVTLLPKKVESFFNDLVKKTIETREKENIIRPDMIQLLMDARKENVAKEKHADDNVTGFATVEEYLENNEQLKLTNGDIAAQAFLFFLGGFETVSAAMCFTTLELAINVDTQKRLQEEIDEIMSKCDGKLSYDDLHLMKYLDMVVSEGLRKWPPFPFIDRQCVKPYTYNSDGKNIHFKKGQAVSIPIFGIHRDPQFYPNPSKFDPERFSDERKGEINPTTYLVFGSGPRNCIGSRFALMEIKIALIYLFGNFNVNLIKKSPVPTILGTKTFNMSVDGGFWVGLTPRKK